MTYPNKSPGDCADCGQSVPAMAGERLRLRGGGWLTIHKGHACPPRPTSESPESPMGDTAETPAPAVYANKYAGPCDLCGQTVQPGQGTRTKTAEGWSMAHTACP